MYLAVVTYMDLDDRPAQRLVGRLRADTENLKRHLAELRAETSD